MRREVRRREALGGLVSVSLVVGCHAKTPPTPRAAARTRILDVLHSVPAIDGHGATVQRVFPSPQLRHLDQFVLLDEFDVRQPAGFPDHPHRGFEAFTYMIEGAFEHKDNLGNTSSISAGGTQRFTSGRGARHSEMPATSGSNRGLQLWVNLPRRLKQMAPSYAGHQRADLPEHGVGQARVRTVVGPQSPIALRTQVDYFDVRLLADGSFSHDIPTERSTLLYVLHGSVGVEGTRLDRGQGVLLDAGALEVRADKHARFALLSGRPHHEPIRHRGPFVD